MDIKEILGKLEQNKNFKQWKNKNPNSYFSYAFNLLHEESGDGLQIGFYNKDDDKVTTFSIEDDKVEVREEEEIFKKPDMSVNKIDVDKIKLPIKVILENADSFRKKNYPNELEEKVITILQNLDGLGDIWNLTYITKSFNTLNLKIGAENGQVLKHKLTSIFDFKK